VSHADELIDCFQQGSGNETADRALEEIIKSCDQFREAEKQIQPIITTIENMTARNQKCTPSSRSSSLSRETICLGASHRCTRRTLV